MNLVSPEYRAMIERLLARLQPHECEPGEFELARRLHALPLGVDLFSLCFITPDGETIRVESTEAGEKVTRSSCEKELFAFVVTSITRYPALGALIPERPENAPDCLGCDGGKISRHAVDCSTGQPATCFACHGLGWVPEEWRS